MKIFAEMIAFLIVVRIDVLVINRKAYNDDYVGLFLALIIYLTMAFVVERFRHLNSKMNHNLSNDISISLLDTSHTLVGSFLVSINKIDNQQLIQSLKFRKQTEFSSIPFLPAVLLLSS